MKSLSTLALALVLAGCATASQDQRQTVMNAANLAVQKQTLKDSAQERKPVRAGQWVTFLVESHTGDNDLTLRTIKVLQVDGDRVRLEIDSQSALTDGTLSSEGYEITNFPTTPPLAYNRREHKKMVTRMAFKRGIQKKPDKEQEEWTPALLIFNKPMLEKIVPTGYVLDNTKIETGPCANEHIDSSVCYNYRYKLELHKDAFVGRVSAHSEVPILGFVAADDEARSYKVIAFGDTGAKARLTY